MTGIADAFGGKFNEAYKESLKKSRVKRLDVIGKTREDIIEMVRKTMSPNDPSIKYIPDKKRNYAYDIVLAELPEQIQVRPGKWGPSVSFKWDSNWLKVYLSKIGDKTPEEIIGTLQPLEAYILVGKLKVDNPTTGQWKGRTFYNFSLHGFISMDEIAGKKIEVETQLKEIQEKLEAHLGYPVEKEVIVKEFE